MWVLKTTVTILGEIISDYHKLQGILLLFINIGLLWIVVRNVPYYNSYINCFQGALYSLLTWQALILFSLVWNDDWAQVWSLIQSTCDCKQVQSAPCMPHKRSAHGVHQH